MVCKNSKATRFELLWFMVLSKSVIARNEAISKLCQSTERDRRFACAEMATLSLAMTAMLALFRQFRKFLVRNFFLVQRNDTFQVVEHFKRLHFFKYLVGFFFVL